MHRSLEKEEIQINFNLSKEKALLVLRFSSEDEEAIGNHHKEILGQMRYQWPPELMKLY